MNHNTSEHMTWGHYPHGGPNMSKTLLSLMLSSFSTFMSTHTLNHCHKPRQLAPTVGLMRFTYMRSMVFRSISKFLLGSRLVFRSLLFFANKMGNLSLQEPKPREVTGSDTDRFPPMPIRASLALESWLEHGSSHMREFESNPSRDRVEHHRINCPEVVDPFYKLSLGSNSHGG
jgi:hypothetical protein